MKLDDRLISDHLAEALLAALVRDSALYRLQREREPWESRLKREIWRRSLRGRWWWFTYRLSQKTEPARRRIAHAIYAFSEIDID